jgi:hypothetical protein
MPKSFAMSSESPRVPHLAKPGSELYDLRDDVDESFERLEGLTGYPRIVEVPGGNILSIGGSPVSSACVGVNLLQGKEKATLTLGTGTSELVVNACRPGTPGNDITLELETGGAEAIAVAGDAITVTLNTGTSTPASVVALLDGDADAARLVKSVSAGVGVIAVAPATNLAGGTGSGFVVSVGGVAQEVNGEVTDVLMPLEVATGTGMVTGDAMELLVVSNGVAAPIMTVDIVA